MLQKELVGDGASSCPTEGNEIIFSFIYIQPSQLPTGKGNCLRYCHRRENHRQQIFAVDHLFTIQYEPSSILLKIFSFIPMFTLLRSVENIQIHNINKCCN